MKLDKICNMDFWSAFPTTTVAPFVISEMTTKFGVNSTLLFVPEWFELGEEIVDRVKFFQAQIDEIIFQLMISQHILFPKSTSSVV